MATQPPPSNIAASVATEAFLRALFEASPTPLLVLEPNDDFRILMVTDAYLRVTMTKREDIVGRPAFDVFPDDPNDPAATGVRNLTASLHRVLRDRKPEALEVQRFPIPSADAPGGFEERYWTPSHAPMLDAQGNVLCIIHRVEDVTQLTNDQHLRDLIDGIPELAWTAKADGFIDFYNRRWYQYTGTTPAQMQGWGWKAVHHPDLIDSVMERWKRSLDTGEAFEMEFKLRGADGVFRWFLTRIAPFKSADGKTVLRWFGTNTNIDDFRRLREKLAISADEAERARLASEALQKAQQSTTDRYRALVEVTGDIVWTNSPEGEMRGPQPGWSSYTGQSEEEVEGYGWSAAVHPEDAQPSIDAWSHAVAARSKFVFEHRVRRRDGVYRWFAICAVPVLEPDGTIREWVGLHRDVDDQKRRGEALAQARIAAEQANSAKDDFLAMLGHELRNPLSPIMTAIHLLKLRSGAGTAREVEVIERQTEHLTRLVDDLLDVSRITRGKVTLNRDSVEMADVVAAAIEMASPTLENGRHQLITNVPTQGLVVDVDRVRMAQVVGNLLTNAAKYTPAGGRITLSVERDGGDVVLKVQDNGVGISADLLPRVFDLFVQARQTLARAQGGLGLGLAIVKNLVTLHGGSIAAASEGLGHGSTFTMRLPLIDARATKRRDSGAYRATPEPRLARILVVDDNIDGAEMIAELLGGLGYRTAVAHDGPQALQVAAEFEPQIALLDIGLPVMDGYELAARLRELSADLTLIAITGYGQDGDRERARNAGFADHLTKPVDIEKLGHLLEMQTSAERR